MADSYLQHLREDLSAVAFVPGTDASERFAQILSRGERLLRVKLSFEADRAEDAPPLVVIAGGTNVGKSTVFNWVVGDGVASASPLARHTKAPTIYLHTDELAALRNGAFLPSYRRLTLATPTDPTEESGEDPCAYFLLTHERGDVRNVVLIDSPDIDSTHARNREVAQDLLFLADAVLFVSTPEKYNDELCVQYLRQACELLKGLTCVLNKGADDDVARDFAQVVLPSLGREVEILTLPFIPEGPDPTTQAAYRGHLQDAALVSAEQASALRRTALRGARARLAADVEAINSRLREELSELDRIRSEVELALDGCRDEYARFLNGLEFYELDRVFERVLEYFRIPVLDTVYTGFRNVVSFVTSNVGRIVSGREAQDSRKARMQARVELDRQKTKELLEATRAAVLELPYLHASALNEAVPSWVEGLASPSVEQINAAIEQFQNLADGEAERWVEAETQRHVTMLEGHPYARAALRTLKGTTQIGFGLLSAKLTGGFGPWDLLIGTATERGVKKILETAGGYVHYQTLKSEFAKTRAGIFRTLLSQSVGDPLLARLPTGIDPERLDRLGGAASILRREGAVGVSV